MVRSVEELAGKSHALPAGNLPESRMDRASWSNCIGAKQATGVAQAGVGIVSTDVAVMGGASGARGCDDRATLTLRFADGSLGTIHYLANGHQAFPKERLDVFCGGRVLQLDNFRKLTGWGWPSFSSMRLWRQDKGQRACAAAFLAAVGGGAGAAAAPIPFEELIEVSRVAIEAAEKARC